MKKSVTLAVTCLALFGTAAIALGKKSTILDYLPAFLHHEPDPPVFGDPPRGNGQYVVIAWNDLGMHCMDPSFEDFSVLPPYNNLVAQVIRRGGEPQIVTQGVSVQYRILGNTTSADKTNFWQYAQALFGLSAPLPKNIGLAGKGLSGTMNLAADHFIAEGIPVTEIFDNRAKSPYQLAEVVVKDAQGTILAGTHAVVPVSTELHCEYCHGDGGSANESIATGNVKQNILTLHDQNEGTSLMANRPVLCADCHSSNALRKPGRPGLPSLSSAIHNRHASIDDGTINTCYKCHPGPQTKCLRDIMFQAGLRCHDCHGTMAQVANPQREPWLEEPRCADCHAFPYQENANTLYRNSRGGHHNIMCAACHGSPHAIYPSVEPLDNKQSIWLQGTAGPINSCGVCHSNRPGQKGNPHLAGDD